ncbi:hypothetical protein [Lysobacter humi (ex Lee et al. 2017)]
MDRLTALIGLVLALFGCDGAASRFVHRDREGGIDRLHAAVVFDGATARLDCIASRAGRCRFRIADAGCAAPRIPACAAPVDVLVDGGGSLRVDAPASLRACIDVPGDATPAACETLGGTPSRK